jgi:hypothetical protein
MNNSPGGEEDKGCPATSALSVIPPGWGATHGRVERITRCNAYSARACSRCLAKVDLCLHCKTLEQL